jgi:hypothetical protein
MALLRAHRLANNQLGRQQAEEAGTAPLNLPPDAPIMTP